MPFHFGVYPTLEFPADQRCRISSSVVASTQDTHLSLTSRRRFALLASSNLRMAFEASAEVQAYMTAGCMTRLFVKMAAAMPYWSEV